MGLETLAGIGVSAAGQVAGGYTASALMGDTSYPKGGGINGLTSADAGKSGITQAIQIDPTTALNYFQSAANSFQTQSLSGLGLYNQAIQQAGAQLSSGYNAANATLKPLSQAGQAATNEYMKMLGLNTTSPTGDIASQVGALGFGDLASQISQAEKIEDPAQRQAAKDSIMANFQQAINTQGNTYSQQHQQALSQLAPAMDWSTALTTSQNAFNAARGGTRDGSAQAALNNQYKLTDPNTVKSLSPELQKQYNAYIQQGDYAAANATIMMGASQNNYQQQVNALNSQYGSGTDKTGSSLSSLMNQYNQGYQQNADYLGYTGQEVTDRIRATPGYQFQLDQGLEAINRTAAAAGMLSSGNTLLAANNYAQNQADSYYNSYMSNLNNLMGYGTSATGQIASNQANLGTGLASLTQSGGNAALNTYQNIGQALYQAYTNSGNLWNQDMLANMQAQNSMLQQSNALSTQAGIAANQTQTSNGYLGLQQGMYLNNLANNQGYANSVNRLTLG